MKHPSHAGFTSVELVIAMVAAAIFALTAGTLIFLAHTGWRDGLVAVNLQRDATFALDMITHQLRPAGPNRVTITTGRIEIATTGTTHAIYLDGNDLLHDPDTDTDDDEVVLIQNRVNAFTPSEAVQGVAVTLTLVDGENTITMNSRTRWRN